MILSTFTSSLFAFEGIPTFAPEHFARVRQIDTMKRKQFVKGINQIAQVGAIQIFQEFNTGMEVFPDGYLHYIHFPDDISEHQTAGHLQHLQ